MYDLGGMEMDVFRMKKQSAVLGTCEPAAFILSLRDGNEFCKTHSSGYHCIPHIGEYVFFFFFRASHVRLAQVSSNVYACAYPVRCLVAQLGVARAGRVATWLDQKYFVVDRVNYSPLCFPILFITICLLLSRHPLVYLHATLPN